LIESRRKKVEVKPPNNEPKRINQNIVTGVAVAVLAVIGVSMSAKQPVVHAAADHTVKFAWVIREKF
jgi:hypothetical protein